MVAEFADMTLLQAAALRLERMDLDEGVAVGLAFVGEVWDWVEEEGRIWRADDAVVGVVFERAEGGAELDTAVVGVVLEGVTVRVFDDAADDTTACGVASAVPAKSRTRVVGFIFRECCMIEKYRL